MQISMFRSGHAKKKQKGNHRRMQVVGIHLAWGYEKHL